MISWKEWDAWSGADGQAIFAILVEVHGEKGAVPSPVEIPHYVRGLSWEVRSRKMEKGTLGRIKGMIIYGFGQIQWKDIAPVKAGVSRDLPFCLAKSLSTRDPLLPNVNFSYFQKFDMLPPDPFLHLMG
jgi:hypothetical protein